MKKKLKSIKKPEFINKLTPMQQRVFSAVIMAGLFFGVLFSGGVSFAVVVTVVSAIAYYEWVGLFYKDKLPREVLLSGIGVLILAGVFASVLSLEFVLSFLFVGMACVCGVSFFPDKERKKTTLPLALSFGVPYIGTTLAVLINMRNQGMLEITGTPVGTVLMLFLIVWATDIAALFVGKNFGKHKLAPEISPNKTVEGLIGGMVAAGLTGLLFARILLGGHVFSFFFVGIFLAVVAQCGDLMESSMKRSIGKKDSGNIIPGHGGILDRIDGLLAAAPFYMLFVRIILT